jgi:nucleotide-binding universal stress UspA family protein
MDEKVINLASLPFSRAMLLKGRLESEGIECFITNVNLIQPAISTGVKIFVKEKDLSKALKIVSKIETEYSKEKIADLKVDTKLRKILVPVDFSHYSFIAADLATHIASKLDAEIHLLHAYFNPVVNIAPLFDANTYPANMNNVVESIELKAKEQLIDFEEKILQNVKQFTDKEIIIKHSLIFGTAADTILYLCEDYKPDLVVMGTKGKGDRADDIVGSVTNKVIKNSNIPVLVIPQKFEYNNFDEIKNILYVTDFDDSDYRAIWKLASLISPFEMKLYCLHIGETSEIFWGKSKMDVLKPHIKRTFPKISLSCEVIQSNDRAEAIQKYINSKNIDILSFTSHKKTLLEAIFFPDTFKQMLFQSTIPVFVFPSQKSNS